MKILGRWRDEPGCGGWCKDGLAYRTWVVGGGAPVYIWSNCSDLNVFTFFHNHYIGVDSISGFSSIDECKQDADRVSKEFGWILCETEDEEERYRLMI
jgi:hypothetical protein